MGAEAILDTIATSVGAIGAGGALVIAALAYRRQTIDRHREQASRVAAWIELDWIMAHGGVRVRPRKFLLHVRNASQQPIFNVIALLRDRVTRHGLGNTVLATLAPNADETIDVSPTARNAQGTLFVTLSFVDGAGNQWTRHSDTGELIDGGRAQIAVDPGPPAEPDLGSK